LAETLEHSLIPEHEILSKTEEEKVLNSLKISRQNLPKIRHDDAVVKSIGAKPGDVVRIKRRDHTMYYRLVVKSSI